MGRNMKYDYHYGEESEQYSFFRIPRELIKNENFKGISSNAKLLYGLMMDRMGVSKKKGWIDEHNRVFIYYTIDNIMEDLGCSRTTGIKILAELDCKKGIGLIEKKRQGLGLPDVIYVKKFVLDKQWQDCGDCKSPKDGFSEVQDCDFQKSKKYTSRSSNSEFAEVKKVDANNINNNYTNVNNQSIDLSVQEKNSEDAGGSVYEKCVTIVKENVEYETLRWEMGYDSNRLDEIVELIAEIISVERTSIRIGGTEYPYQMVKNKLLELRSEHIRYVLECMRKTSTKIANIKSYLITALYNAPITINNYYQAEVNHDMFG